jgi:hypothetical protein
VVSSVAPSDEHREDHGVGDEQRRHRERGDVVGRAQADAEAEALVERVEKIDSPDDVEEPDESKRGRPARPERENRRERQERREQVAVPRRNEGSASPTTVGTRKTIPR